MTREEAKVLLPIIQAFAEGKVIECRTKPSALIDTGVPNEWKETKEIGFWCDIEYRIKPELKYRPFKDAKECWQEMQKHQPFGLLKDKRGNKLIIENIDLRGCVEVYDEGACTFKDIFKDYTFVDRTPFGIKE